MQLSATELKKLRKLLADHYPTYADAQRIVEDLEWEVTIDKNASVFTIWSTILKQAIAANKLKALIEIAEEEGVETGISQQRSIGFNEDPRKQENPTLLFKNHLLLIGIDQYKNGIPKLNNAVRDIEAFKKVALERYQFSKENCTELIDSQASRKNIIAAFRKLQNELTDEDNLIFYFSGHGELDKSTQIGYWIPVDAQGGDYSSYLANNEILQYLKTLRTKHTFGIVDACFSGSMFMKSTLEVVQRYYNLSSRWLMTSGLEEPVPDGAKGHHSPFSASLLAQLQANYQPALSTNQLWGKMREGVIANSAQTPRCEPIQGAGHQGGEFFFLLKNAEFKDIPTTAQIDQHTPLRQVVSTSTNSASLKMQLRQLITKDELEEVFDILNNRLSEQSSHKMLVYGRQGGYNSLKRRMNQGIVSTEHSNIQMAQIRQALLYVINEMEEADLQ